MPKPVIVAQNLSKYFGSVCAVQSVDFSVSQGEIVGLLGGNGAGKTTTILMMLGMLIPSSGYISVLNADMARNRFAALGRMNFSSPYLELPHRLTVRQNLTVYAHLYNVADPKARIRELTDDLALEEFVDRPAGRLSAGQKTRVALAKALINRPEVLLLDEPTASLDPDTADWVRSYLERYRLDTGCAIVLASHNMFEVERLCDFVLMMKRGSIVGRGKPRTLIEHYGRTTMEEVFLDIARGRERSSMDLPALSHADDTKQAAHLPLS